MKDNPGDDCGKFVITKLGRITGMITAVCYRFDQITYEITTIVDGKHYSDWYRLQEFEFSNITETPAGFNKQTK